MQKDKRVTEERRIRFEDATIKLASGLSSSVVEKADSEPILAKREYGCLTVFDDFKTVLCGKIPYDLTDATQARELLRFLCEKKALNKRTAQNKEAILKSLKASSKTVANDWRPAHVFRGKLAALYRNAVGRSPTKGLYWINP